MHHRQRHIEEILLKRARMFPVLGLLGARQVGKSTFLMDQWCVKKDGTYLTFDKQETAMRAKNAPSQLLTDESEGQTKHLVIDEAHKVPHLFDSIKALIDEERRMGAFMLSGSVEFSSKSGVRESLAGRMGISRLYPMTLRELSQQPFESPWVNLNFTPSLPLPPKHIEHWIERGGMPIFCGLSDADERTALIYSWLEAICYRDLTQLKDYQYDGELAFNLLHLLANQAITPITKLTRLLGASASAIKKHLSALEALFLIYKIPSFTNNRAQPMYRFFDAGVLNALIGGRHIPQTREACLLSLLTNEIYAQYEYAGKLKPKLYYYRSRGGAQIDLVLQSRENLVAINCQSSIHIPPYEQRGMKSFLEKYQESGAIGYFVAPVSKPYQLADKLFVIPWNYIG